MQPILSVRNFLMAATALWLCSSCQSVSLPPASAVLTNENLSEQLFIIDTRKDTTLLSAAGIRVHIPAGSIKSTTTSVTVIVKEALSLYDMLRAGLTTRSGDKLLRSNGMFYIATKEVSELTKPLKVDVPVALADPAMQLFKGVEENGRVDWQEPVELKVDTLDAYRNGKKIFESSCASCHGIEKPLTGSALANVETRWTNREHLYRAIRNYAELIYSGDCGYVGFRYCGSSRNGMMPFSFTDEEIEDILTYIRRESARLGIKDTIAFREPEVDEFYDQLKKLNQVEVPIKRYAYARKKMEAVENKIVTPVKLGSTESYNLSIYNFGWYNIDAWLYNRPDVIQSTLKVRVEGSRDKVVNTYLIVPDDKIFTEGGLLNNNREYGFWEQDGSIPMKPGIKAYILASGELDGHILFGATPFVTTKEQLITVVVKQVTQDEMDTVLRRLSLNKAPDNKTTKETEREFREFARELKRAGWDCLF